MRIPDSEVSRPRKRLLNFISVGLIMPVSVLAVFSYFNELPEVSDWGIRLHGDTATFLLIAVALTLVLQGIKFYDQRRD